MFGLSDFAGAIVRGIALNVIALLAVVAAVRTIGLRAFST